MKILIATDCYIYNLCGVTTSVLALRRGLLRLGHEIRILSLSNNNHSFHDGDDYFIRSFPAIYYPDMRMSFAMRDPLLRELEKWEPDIIHIQTEGTTRRMALKMNKHCRVPIVMTCHTDYSHYIFHGMNTLAPVKIIMRMAGRILYGCADRVTTPSRKAASFPFLDSVRDRLTVIPNGMEIDQFQKHFTREERCAFRASMGIGNHTGVLVTVSRLSREKNIQELLSFLPGLLKEVPDTKLLIVGDGPYRMKLEKMAEKLRITDNVVFAGRIPSQDVWQYYDAGDVFVSASTFETQGLTYYEAMTCGLAMVCREDACLTGVLEQYQNAVAYRSEAEFIDFTARILGNEKLLAKTGQYASRKTAGYSCDAFAGAMLSVYQDAIAERKTGFGRK